MNCTSGLVLLCFFLINFFGVNFEAGNETREKIRSDLVAEQSVKRFVILVLNKIEERSEKRVVFVHTAVFERARN